MWYDTGMDIQTLKEGIAGIHDARRTSHGHIRHRLEDIVIIGLCVATCGGEDFSDMETFGRERERWLRGFLKLPNGIPNADTFCRVFERLDPQELGRCLRRWLDAERGARGVVAVDGKTIRGSAGAGHGACHVVSAFAAESRLVLGEMCVAEKSNEVEAVPELLDMVDVEGAIVTADAMSCQRGGGGRRGRSRSGRRATSARSRTTSRSCWRTCGPASGRSARPRRGRRPSTRATGAWSGASTPSQRTSDGSRSVRGGGR